ncbi:Pol protein [Phytophthora palmivora]|uniref:Pol protein n=1 Tax=Phytophthora palmivora TaxID=4796 RepID=A0A2P4YR07_9STRA|nr:Pol protein [Phytophthora palmivora]
MASDQDRQKEYSDKHGIGNLCVFKRESNKLKHRSIGHFAALDIHGAAYTIDLLKSMATHPTFYVGRLKRYHDPLGPSPRTEEGQGESTPPRNEDESSGQPELPVSKPVNGIQAGTHASHAKGMTVPNGKRQLPVKWRGYPSSQNSWEPEDRLRVDCPKAVEIWDQQQQPWRK